MKKFGLALTLLCILTGCVEKTNTTESQNNTSQQVTSAKSYSVPKLVGEDEVEGTEHKSYLEKTLTKDEISTINNIDKAGIYSTGNGGHYADHFSKPNYVKLVSVEKKVDDLLAILDTYVLSSADSANIARGWNKDHKQ